MNVPLFDAKREYESIKDEIDAAVASVLASGRFIGGDNVSGFEDEFASYLGADAAIGLNSGTDALRLALQALGVGAGDEVIAPANTFTATIMAIEAVGATPVLVDVDRDLYLMTAEGAERAITSATKAIIPVHLFGAVAEMESFVRLADAHGLALIEDTAQAHGAKAHGRSAGTWGDAGCFSFYPSKNLGAYGDGGAVVGSAEMIDKLRPLRDLGRDEGGNHIEVGSNSRLDSLQAAILRVKLGHLPRWTERRKELASVYDEALAGSNVVTPARPDYGDHVFHLYVVRVQDRDRLLAAGEAAGIGFGIHYPVPIHLQPAHLGRVKVPFGAPVTETASDEIVSLPLFPQMTDDEQQLVIEVTLRTAGD